MTTDGVRASSGTARRLPPRVARLGAYVFPTGRYLSLLIASAVMLVPLVVVFMTSLKTDREMASGGPLTPPRNWLNLRNYAVAFTKGDMLLAFGNTAFVLLFSIAGTVVIGSMAAYALDRFKFRLKPLVVGLFLLATLVPGVTTQVATFQVVNFFGLFNTRWAPILLFMGTDIVSIYIFMQFIRGIPISLDEAARLDGATSFGTYRKVIFPLLKPAIVTVVIVKGIAVYNDFYIPFLYLPSSDLGMISTSLFRFKGPFGAHWENISAGAILVIIPTLIVFLVLQRFIYNGFTSGAVK